MIAIGTSLLSVLELLLCILSLKIHKFYLKDIKKLIKKSNFLLPGTLINHTNTVFCTVINQLPESQGSHSLLEISMFELHQAQQPKTNISPCK